MMFVGCTVAHSQADHRRGALAVNVASEVRGDVVSLSASVYGGRLLFGDGAANELRLSWGLGVSEDGVARRDTPFAVLKIGVRRDVAIVSGSTQSPRLAVAVAVDVGLDYATPFDSVVAAGVTVRLGRQSIILPAVAFELSGRVIRTSDRSPVALSLQLG